MATMKHLLWAWLGLLSLILIAQPAISQSRTYYTATDQTTALMSPGTINFPDGNVHIRGAVVQTRVTSSLFSGNMIVTLNANWNKNFCGPVWGTFVLTLDTGGVWEGTWAGKRALAAGGWSASLVAEGYGTGPGIDGPPHGLLSKVLHRPDIRVEFLTENRQLSAIGRRDAPSAGC